MVETEFYRKSQEENLDGIVNYLNKNIEQRNQKSTLYLELGFDTLAAKVNSADLYYPKLSAYESWVWSNFLPTIYSSKPSDSSVLSWAEFSYDEIPEECLREIQYAKSLQCFDKIWIQTPEKIRHNDPTVFGIVTRGRNLRDEYLITRWGESLLPFPQIERKVFWDTLKWEGFSDCRINATDTVREIGFIISERMKNEINLNSLPWGCVIKSIFRHCSERMFKLKFFNPGKNSHVKYYVCGECGDVS